MRDMCGVCHMRRMSYAEDICGVVCACHVRMGGFWLAPGQFTPQTFQLWQPQSLRHMGSCLAGPVPGRFARKRHGCDRHRGPNGHPGDTPTVIVTHGFVFGWPCARTVRTEAPRVIATADRTGFKRFANPRGIKTSERRYAYHAHPDDNTR